MQRAYREIVAADVGRDTFNAFGRVWLASDFIGRILPGDVGKRVYKVGDILQVENDEQRAARLPRFVDANDLELFAINTGQFYELHKRLASEPLGVWAQHVATTVKPRYCREVEPVQISAETVATVAANLKAYYERHLAETAALNATEKKGD